MESGWAFLTYLDTHVALWLCTGAVTFSSAVLDRIDLDDLRLSPVVLLEMRFLHEIGRVSVSPAEWLLILGRDFGVSVCDLSFHSVIEASTELGWTRDPFDRIIVAQALAGEGTLITKDQTILENFPSALW